MIDVVPEMKDLFLELQKNNQPLVMRELELNRKDKKLTLITKITVEKDKNRILGYVVTFDDMTEFYKIQRVAAWSDVARRIAHEIKNPLTPIQLAAERIKRKYKNHITLEPDVFLSCISIIIRQVDGMRKMVDEFSAFSRMPTPVYKKTNLTKLVRELGSISLLSNKTIDVNIVIPKSNIFAIIDENQIRQALQNVISNAINSMSERKNKKNRKNELIIELKNISNIRYVILVKDSGIGLPSGILEDLTDPYVTTRINGTGLGLAIVKKIMEDHNGELILDDLKNNSGVCASLVFSDKV